MYLTGIKTYLQLRNNLRKSLDQLKAEQWDKFRNLVRFAYLNVPFYRDLYAQAGFSPDDLRTPDDVTMVPITNKRMFQETTLTQLLALGSNPEELVSKRTSGSTGFPLIVYFTADDRIYRTLLHLRTLFENGIGFRDRMVQISDKRNVPNFRYPFQKLGFLPKEFIYCASPVHQQLNALSAMMPDVIYGYTSSLVLIADEIERIGGCSFKPKLVFTTGELINPYDRKKIEDAFQVRVRDIYGLVEMADVAWQCSASDGYHMNIDSFLVEVIANSHPVEVGKSGRLLITNLHSKAMPFIRYDVGDVVTTPHHIVCSCGCSFPRIDVLHGREDDWLFSADGRKISPMDITVARVKGIKQYRITQEQLDYVIVEIVPGQGFDENTLKKVKEHVSEVMGDAVCVAIQKTDHIPRDNGKLKCFISKIEGPNNE